MTKFFAGVEVTANNELLPELMPYRDLDPSRLRLLVEVIGMSRISWMIHW